jgi:hypothetical protein
LGVVSVQARAARAEGRAVSELVKKALAGYAPVRLKINESILTCESSKNHP